MFLFPVGFLIFMGVFFWVIAVPNSLFFLKPVLIPIMGRRRFFIMAYESAQSIWTSFVLFMEGWGSLKYHYSGDVIPLRESAIVMTNHRFFADWLPIFSLAYRHGMLGCCKICAKFWIQYIPGFGWGGSLLGFIWLRRVWNKDQKNIEATFANLKSLKLPVWLITHPEGTRMARGKLAESQEFARQNGLRVMNNVLVPRTKGVIAMIQSLRDGTVDAVYDVTYAYPQGVPTVWNMLNGRIPPVWVHVRRYTIKDLPESADELSKWMFKVWEGKEELLDYHREHGHFPEERNLPMKLVRQHLE